MIKCKPIADPYPGFDFDQEAFDFLSMQSPIAGVGPMGGFAYDLDLSIPYVVTAIHAGHRVRDGLLPFISISEADRQAEEDTATDRIIQGCPSILWGLDSRVEYDLNRPPGLALPLTPERFWGTRVYGTPPTDAVKRICLEKYAAFYRFVGAVIKTLLERFGACVVYDIHSYNLRRQTDKGHPSPPVFNLGTRGIDPVKWEVPVKKWLEHLRQIRISGLNITVAENDVFGGEGEFCRRLTRWDSNILVLSTEISKIYMDEGNGSLHDPVIDALKRELAKSVIAHGSAFQEFFCRRIT